MSSPTLRTASGDDVPALAEVFVAAWRAAYTDVVPAHALAALDLGEVSTWMGGLVADASTTTLVAVLDARVCGFTRCGPDPQRPQAGAGYLAALYVHPNAAGHGVGRALLQAALAALAADGRTDVRLEVFTANERARRMYERAGFTPEGTEQTDERWGAPQVGYRREGHPPSG